MELSQIFKEIRFSAMRSRGPGGQNVNKVSSAAQLNWAFEDSQGLSEEQKFRVRSRLANSINREGELYLRSDEFRDLERNKARCLEKLEAMLVKAFHRPKKRRPTKPTAASKRRKRESKSKRGEIKKGRRKVDW